MNKIIGIDATWLLRRQFHACDKARVSGEFATETEPSKDLVQDKNILIISFLQCLLKYIYKEYEYKYKVVCLWDRGTYRYRPKETFTEYKAGRVYDESYQVCWDAGNELVLLLRKLGILSIQIGGLEADDLGNYYSHNSKECILITSDHDWLQSITPTTKVYLASSKKLMTWEDVIKDHITEPIDLAISKSIIGGHDDLPQVNLGMDLGVGIQKYKTRELPQDILESLDRNMKLSRLDKILTDIEVHAMIKAQEDLTKPSNSFALNVALKGVPNYPAYMLGVLGKYNSIWNGK